MIAVNDVSIEGRMRMSKGWRIWRRAGRGLLMWLRSGAFEDGAIIPRRYTCDGENLSPPLEWGGVPAVARSLAIVCDDPDAPNGTWRHWAAFDIPAQWSRLEEGAADRPGLAQAVNDFGRFGYGGPCPPRGRGRHHYHFRLLALSRDTLGLPQGPTCLAVARAAHGCLLAEAQLIGIYAR